jgi:hypothetical protein
MAKPALRQKQTQLVSAAYQLGQEPGLVMPGTCSQMGKEPSSTGWSWNLIDCSGDDARGYAFASADAVWAGNAGGAEAVENVCGTCGPATSG